MKIRLHINTSADKKPLWWAQRLDRPYPLCLRTTCGYSSAAAALAEALTL